MIYILAYEHWKSKAQIKRSLNHTLCTFDKVIFLDPKNPYIDFICPITFKYATPKEIQFHRKTNSFLFTNKKRSFFGEMSYNLNTKEWSVK